MFSIEPLPSSMPAAVLEAPGRLVVQEIPMWPLADYGDDDLVMVRVEAVGVCGSDFRYFLGENPWAQHTLGRFVPNPPNIVLGHEIAGMVVAALSERNKGLLGKRVAPVCFKVCGWCSECRAGRMRLCPNTVHLGHGQGWGKRDFYPGAYTRYVPAWGASCFEIADHISFPEAATMDILAVCVHVAEQGNIQPGRPVLIIGAGPAGNGVAQVALATGADRVVLLDRSSVAVEQAQKVGIALDTSEMSDEEVHSALKGLAPEGFGSVFDTVGAAKTLDLGLTHLGKAGTLVNLAVHDEPIAFNFLRLGSERKIVTSCNFELGDYPKALAWLTAGRLKVSDWLTSVSLEELPALFERITLDPEEKPVFKLVVEPGGKSA
ncbi:2,3-butanediol dehydrogenase [soil metagenome]